MSKGGRKPESEFGYKTAAAVRGPTVMNDGNYCACMKRSERFLFVFNKFGVPNLLIMT